MPSLEFFSKLGFWILGRKTARGRWMRFPSNFFYLKKNNHLNGDVFSFVDFSRFESSRSPSVRRRSPTSKPRCRESDTRAVARVFSKLGFWILGGKTARGRGSRESHRIFTSPERWRRTLFFLNNWTRGMRSIVLYTHTHIYIYIYIYGLATVRISSRDRVLNRGFRIGCYIPVVS